MGAASTAGFFALTQTGAEALKNVVAKVTSAFKKSDNTIEIDAKNNVVEGMDTELVALVGVHDLIVKKVGDIIVVLPKDRAGDLTKAVNAAKENAKNIALRSYSK